MCEKNEERINLANIVRVLALLRQQGVDQLVMNELETSIGALFGCTFDGVLAVDICQRMLPLVQEVSADYDASMFGESGSETLVEINAKAHEIRSLLRLRSTCKGVPNGVLSSAIVASNHQIFPKGKGRVVAARAHELVVLTHG